MSAFVSIGGDVVSSATVSMLDVCEGCMQARAVGTSRVFRAAVLEVVTPHLTASAHLYGGLRGDRGNGERFAFEKPFACSEVVHDVFVWVVEETERGVGVRLITVCEAVDEEGMVEVFGYDGLPVRVFFDDGVEDLSCSHDGAI